MTARRAHTLIETLVALAIGLATLGAIFQLGSLLRRPSDHRERVREAQVGLALALERVVRSVRDAASVEEAVGPTLLLRSPDGVLDLWQYRPAPGGVGGELVLIEDAIPPGALGTGSGRQPVETVMASGISRCAFWTSGGPPSPGPVAQLSPIAGPVSCVLETLVDGAPVRETSAATWRNGGWEILWQ